MRSLLAIIGIIYLSALTIGCGSLEARIPMAKVESSETIGGQNDGAFFIGSDNVFTYQFSPDASARPPTLNNPSVNAGAGILGGGAYSANPNLDFGLYYSSVGGVGAKAHWQLFGQSPDRSMRNDKSFSVYARAGYDNNSKSGNQNGNFGSGGYPWSAKTNTAYYEAGMAVGTKINNDLLLYLGAAASEFNISGKIDQDPSDTGTSQGGHYSIDSKTGHSYSLALGFDSGRMSKLQFQVGVSELDIDSFREQKGFLNVNYIYSTGAVRHQAELFEEEARKYRASQQAPEYKSEKNEVAPAPAQNAESNSTASFQSQYYPKPTWQGRDYFAVGSAYLIGFGTGQAIQDRWKKEGYLFTAADTIGIAALISSINSGGNSSAALLGIITLGVSRIWQVVDAFVDANKSYGTK